MNKKFIAGIMAMSVLTATVNANTVNAQVVEKKQNTIETTFKTYINGLPVTDFSKIKKEGLGLNIEYFNIFGNYELVKLMSSFEGDKNFVKLPKNMQGVELRPENIKNPNKFGFKVKSADFNYKEGQVPVFAGLKYSGGNQGTPYYLSTKDNSLVAVNYELKYDLKLNFESEDVAKKVEFKVVDHNEDAVSVEKEVKGKTVILNDVLYNPQKSLLKVMSSEKFTTNSENLEVKEMDETTFVLNPNFNNATYEDGKVIVNVDFSTKNIKKSTPLDIKDLEIRKEIYKSNRDILDNFPGDVDIKTAKENFEIYESQIEYIKDLTVNTAVKDLSGIELLKNLKYLDVKTELGKSLDLSKFEKLEYLTMENIGIENLNLENNFKLKSLKLKNNNLSELNIPELENLEWLDLEGNNFENGVDLTNAMSLKHLNLSYQKTPIKTINVKYLSELEHLSVDGHRLEELNLSNNTALQFISANNTKEDNFGLTSIDLSNNMALKQVHFKDNKLETINLDGLHLTGLNLYGNKIKTLSLKNVMFNTENSYMDIMQFIEVNSKGTVDLKEIVGSENLGKIAIDESEKYNYNKETGILEVITDEDFELEYRFNTENIRPQFFSMPVKVKVNVEKEMVTFENNKVKVETTNLNKDAKLVVKKVENTDNKLDLEIFDISFEKMEVKDGKFKVTVEKSKDTEISNVYFIDENGNKTPMEFTTEGNKVIFNTTHFSLYALEYKNSVATSNEKDKKGNEVVENTDDKKDNNKNNNITTKQDKKCTKKVKMLPKTAISSVSSLSMLVVSLAGIVLTKKKNK